MAGLVLDVMLPTFPHLVDSSADGSVYPVNYVNYQVRISFILPQRATAWLLKDVTLVNLSHLRRCRDSASVS